MTQTTAALQTAIQELSPSARRALGGNDVITDEVRALSHRRGAATEAGGSLDDVSRARTALLGVIESLKAKVDVVMNARAGSEKRAEMLLIIGGIIILALPVVSIVANVTGSNIGWGSNLLNGLTAVGFMALMFGPGREIRRAAKDRTILLLLPIGFEARVVAAATLEELRTIASDLQTTLGGLAPQE